MPLAQQRRDVALRLVDDPRRRARHQDVVEPRLALDLLHHGGVRHQERVVLILAGRRLSLHFQHTDDRARLILDADRFADRILFAEQLIGDGLPEHADVAGALDVHLGVHPAARDVPSLEGEILRADTAHRGAPVLVAEDDLDAGVDLRRHVGHERDVVLDRLEVLEHQRLGAERSGPDAAAVHAAGLDPDHVGADVRDRALDVGRRALADRDDADHRADADDDAEHRQAGAERVLPQRFECDAQRRDDLHAPTVMMPPPAAA